MLEGCQGNPRTPTIHEKICPQCGNVIELFSIDTQVACDRCGFVAYNDTLSCVQWCAYARKCVGDEMYEKMMDIVALQKQQAAFFGTHFGEDYRRSTYAFFGTQDHIVKHGEDFAKLYSSARMEEAYFGHWMTEEEFYRDFLPFLEKVYAKENKSRLMP